MKFGFWVSLLSPPVMFTVLNGTNIALQLLNLAYCLNEKKRFALRTGLTIIWCGHV